MFVFLFYDLYSPTGEEYSHNAWPYSGVSYSLIVGPFFWERPPPGSAPQNTPKTPLIL
jgi:hypothetical protein